MKKLIFLVGTIAILSVFSACSVGYVSEQPVYHAYNRPQRPNNNYIWIEGGWRWNNRTNSYVQNDGRWVRQDQGRRYKQGHWEKGHRGYRWVKKSNR